MSRPAHIIDPKPRGAVCARKRCGRPATSYRLLGELIIARDGIHEVVEWVCSRHDIKDSR